MGRADRRRLMREQLKKSQDLKEKYDQNTLMERLTQNGISPNDLKTSYKEGFDEGLKVAARPILKTTYGALCLILSEKYGFTPEKCLEALIAFDQKVTYAINEDEYVGETFDKLGLEIDFSGATDRVIAPDSFGVPLV